MNILNISISDNQPCLNTIWNRRISACFTLFFGLLVLLSANFTLLGADEDVVPQVNQDEMTCEKLYNKVNSIYNKLLDNQDSEAFPKIRETLKTGEKLQDDKRYKDAIIEYTVMINWYNSFSKMQPRLEKWQNIMGKLTDQLSEKTKLEWLTLKEKLSKDKTNEWLTLCEQLSNKTKNKWLTELEKATTDERRIWIIWLLSLDSLIDYPDVAPCLDGVAIDKDDDAITIFSDMFSGSRHEYGVFKESFEQYMEAWQELLSAHCLEKDVEQAIFDIIARQKDYFSNNLVTTRLRSKLRSEIKKWIDLQIDSYDDFMQKNKREKQENKP